MATSETDICNVALARVGQKQFISDLEEATPEAQLCAVLYAQTRDVLLASFPWPFATKRLSLAQLSGVTRSGWGYVYELPADCLSPQYIFNGLRRGAPASACIGEPHPALNGLWVQAGQSIKIAFAVEASDDGASRVLLCDQSTVELVYTARMTTPTLFPPLFVDALCWAMAAELALSLVVKPQLEQQCRARYQAALAKAGATAFRESQDDGRPDSEFISVRG